VTRPWPTDVVEDVRQAQADRGWSDRQLLAQLVAFARRDGAGRETPAEEVVLEALDRTRGRPDGERVEAVARVLPLYWGPWGTTVLSGELVREPEVPEDEVEAVLTVPGHLPPGIRPTPDVRHPRVPARRRSGSRGWRQPLLIMAGTWVCLLAVAAVVVAVR